MERLTKRTGKHSVQFKGATYRDEERYGQIYKYQMASIICAYEDTGLTPEEIEQNKEYIQILEKENKLIKEQYIKEADTVDCYKKLATENAKLKELIKELGWKYENR